MTHPQKRPGRGWETLIAVAAALAAGGAGGYLIANRGGSAGTSANTGSAPATATSVLNMRPGSTPNARAASSAAGPAPVYA